MTNSMGPLSVSDVMGRCSTHCVDSTAVWVGGTLNSSNSDLPHSQLDGWTKAMTCTLWGLDDDWKDDERFRYLWEKMSLATFRLRLLTFPEPVCERVAGRVGLARRAGETLAGQARHAGATLAGWAQTAGVGRALAAAGRRRQADWGAAASPPAPIGCLPRMPLATTKSPVFTTCSPACFRRGVASFNMFLITRPMPYPLW